MSPAPTPRRPPDASSWPRAGPFVLPVAVSLLFILWAPFIVQIRNALQNAFPTSFVRIVGGGAAAVLATACLVALAQIRHHRWQRYGALAAASMLLLAYTRAFATGIPEVDAVERVHVVEYSLVAVLFYRVWRPAGDPSMLLLPLFAGTMVGTLEEGFQWFVPIRIGDARDVLLNTYAVACGLVFSLASMPPERFSWGMRPGSWWRVCRLAAVALVVFGLFFHAAHLGYEIEDEEIGRFRSFYTRAGLQRAARERAETWRARPPGPPTTLGPEDFFVTEALWRVQRRNECLTRGDFFAAWWENRILEKYYEPVLRVAPLISGEHHHLAREDAEEVARKAGDLGSRRYVSDSHRTMIVVAPTKPQFWAMVTLALAALWVAPLALERRGQRL